MLDTTEESERTQIFESLKALQRCATDDFIQGRTATEWTTRFSWPERINKSKLHEVLSQLEERGNV